MSAQKTDQATDYRAFSPLRVGLRGTHLIEASAGTGKTYTITTLLLRMVVELGLDVREILVVTYTRAATAELRDRARGRLQTALFALEGHGDFGGDATLAGYFAEREAHKPQDVARLRNALRGFDEASIFTIHGFCQRALTDSAFESGAAFDVEFLQDQRPLLVQIAADHWARKTYEASSDVVSHLLDEHPPERLVELSQVIAGNPSLYVIPEAREALPPPPEPDRFARLKNAAAACLDSERETVERLLLDRGSPLSGTVYKPATVRDKWLPWFGAPAALPTEEDLKWLAKLTPEGLKVNKGKARPESPFFEACVPLLEEGQRWLTWLRAVELDCALEMVDYLRTELPERKRKAGVQSFDDLLTALDAALQGAGAGELLGRLRGQYRAALIDEFQDTDPLQYRVFSRIFGVGETSLFLIGDPKQAIYGFRGADVFAYLAAAAERPEAPFGLTTNYRSDPTLLAAVNHLFLRAERPFATEGIAYHPVAARPGAEPAIGGDGDAPLQLLFVGSEGGEAGFAGQPAAAAKAQLAEAMAAEVAQLLGGPARLYDRPVQAHDVAILCRTNDQARSVQQALRERGIPSALEGDDSVFDSAMAGELRRVMTALVHPGDGRSIKSALATSLFGLTAEALYGLERQSDAAETAPDEQKGAGGGEDAWDDWVERFFGWHQLWKERGFVQAFFRMLDEARIQRRLLALPDGERRLTNLLHLVELLHGAAVGQHLGPLALLQWFGDMCSNEESRVGMAADSAQIRLESDARAVRLTTIHKSKGLEYPVVFCPFLWGKASLHPVDRRFPRFHTDDGKLCVDVGGRDEANKQRAEAEAFGEALRLLYVALTRAKHRCYVVWGGFREAEKSPLAHLLHGPADPLAGEDARKRIKGLSDGERMAELQALAAGCDGHIGVRPLHSRGVVVPASVAVTTLVAPRPVREPRVSFRMASFSSLTADAHGGAGGDGGTAGVRHEVGRDRDEATQAVLGPELVFASGSVEDSGSVASEAAPAASTDAEPDAEAARVPLHGFPAGARPGTLIHDIFENLDFLDAPLSRVQDATSASLKRFGVASGWAPVLAGAVHGSLYAPLSAAQPDLCLARLPMSDRLNELEFTLSVGRPEALVSVAAVADLLASHGATGVDAEYHARLRGLGREAFCGYLRGFMDLVFRYGDRYFVVDYKSNHLGPTAADYVAPRLLSAMQAHHYLLQYQLYTVALDRHLRRALPGYEYARHFGGVLYLFVRGMAPDQPAGHGVFFDRPSAAQVSQLGALLCGSDTMEPRHG